MNDGQGSGEVVDVAEGRLSLNDLPDELLILIFNRLLDPKCLCLCSLVSPRFSSLILLHVRSVHFAVTRRRTTTTTADNLARKTLRFFGKPLEYFRQALDGGSKLRPSYFSYMVSFYGRSFCTAVDFLTKFKSITSLHLVIPSPPNASLFKWTAKFGASIDTFVFFVTSTIRDGTEFEFDQHEEEQEEDSLVLKYRVFFAFQCLKEAISRHRTLRDFVCEHPLLENIIFTDSKNQGILSLRDSDVVEMRNWLNSLSPEVKYLVLVEDIQVPVNVKRWHVPVMKLPRSKKVMAGATLFVMEMEHMVYHQCADWGGDAEAIATLFSQHGDEEFAEAIVEMMVNHNSRMHILI